VITRTGGKDDRGYFSTDSAHVAAAVRSR